MIKFLRKIRQKMLTENKFSKYLLYAVGEIILVVIGILIALQLNNYSDGLKQKKQELKIINNLKLDFEFNLSEMEKNINILKENTNASLETINHTGNKFSDDFEINGLIERIVWIPQYFPQNGFLLELVNSGNLGIISNDLLRNKLSSWLPTLETLNDREQFALEFCKDLIRYINVNGNWLQADEMATDELIVGTGFPKSGFENDNENMLKSVEFENLIENQVANSVVLLERQERCLKLNKEIIELLTSEINK
ncbi:DUF6090 family protein [Maribacter antarcticus]|uniref:DUF6090 family protein n=1 Tax=Maribacter antarcticus TaxID=505250 RepID=UPI00047D38C3|nr:DUF6090 family protein [Maribacter antarcticus]